MAGEVLGEGGFQGLIQFGAPSLAAGDRLLMSYLAAVSGLTGEVMQKGSRIHRQPRLRYGENLNLIVHYLYLKAAVDDKVHRLGEDFVGVSLVIADAGDAQRG